MNFWNDLVGGIKSLLVPLENGEKENELKWPNIEPKFEQLLMSFRTKSADKQTQKTIITLLSEINGILDQGRVLFNNEPMIYFKYRNFLLDICLFLLTEAKIMLNAMINRLNVNNNKDGEKKSNSGEKAHQWSFTVTDLNVFQRTIANIIGRKEFDLTEFGIGLNTDHNNNNNNNSNNNNNNSNNNMSDMNLKIASKYRIVLYETQLYVQSSLNYRLENNIAININNLIFYGKVLSINSIRIPKVMSLITQSIALSKKEISFLQSNHYFSSPYWQLLFQSLPINDELKAATSSPSLNLANENEGDRSVSLSEMIEATPDLPVTPLDRLVDRKHDDRDRIDDKKGNNNSNEGDDLIAKFPSLFLWPIFHKILRGNEEEEEYEKNIKEGKWLSALRSRDDLFFCFVDHYILHLLFLSSPSSSLPQINWEVIKDYKIIMTSLLYALIKRSQSEGFTKELLDASKSILLTNPSLLNFFVYHLFSSTNVFDVQITIGALNIVNKWLSNLQYHKIKLPREFDIQFFAKGIDILFHTDHHQITLATLSLLYECADIFDHSNRSILFVDLVIHKYFYHLFLHWDFSVRNAYQQLIIFKLLFDRPVPSIPSPLDDPSDILIKGKIQSYLLTIEDRSCPQHLAVYAEKSLLEYQSFLNLYNDLTFRNAKKPQKIIPYSLLPRSVKSKSSSS